MIKKELVDFVKEAKKRGFRDEVIATRLIEKGWPHKEVKEVIFTGKTNEDSEEEAIYLEEKSNLPTEVKKKDGLINSMLILLILLLLGGLIIVILKKDISFLGITSMTQLKFVLMGFLILALIILGVLFIKSKMKKSLNKDEESKIEEKVPEANISEDPHNLINEYPQNTKEPSKILYEKKTVEVKNLKRKKMQKDKGKKREPKSMIKPEEKEAKIETKENVKKESVIEVGSRIGTTEVDTLYKKLGDIKKVKLDVLASEFKVPEERILQWCKILEKNDLARIIYPAFGTPTVEIKENNEEK